MTRLVVDTVAIRTLAEILQDTGLTEIEISEKDSRIRVVRAPAVVQAAVAPVAAAVHAAAPSAAALSDGVESDDFANHAGAVKSPMVGVAYLSPEPGAPPFVTIGQTVTLGQTLLLIEAMKTFNQIKAPRAGTVSRILVTAGGPVEFGEVLMLLNG